MFFLGIPKRGAGSFILLGELNSSKGTYFFANSQHTFSMSAEGRSLKQNQLTEIHQRLSELQLL